MLFAIVRRRDEPHEPVLPDVQIRLSALDRFTPFVVLLLALAYWTLFIPPNLVGSADHDMLAVASGSPDNGRMYDCLINMRTGRSLSETLHNFLYYEWYYYGYLFFLLSRLATLPLVVLNKLGLIDPTHAVAAYMLAVKQLASLYIVLASGLLVYAWTGFRSLIQSAFLLLFLFSIPLVFAANLSWHPESLATLFVVLTILALAKDALRFGRWFYVAALFCGCAVGVKVIGVFLGPSIAVYLILGSLRHYGRGEQVMGSAAGRGWLKSAGDATVLTVKHGTLFVVIMIAGFVITNPLIVLPEMLKEYVADAKGSIEWGREGFLLGQLMQPSGAKSWYGELSHNCGRWWLYVLILGISIVGILSDGRTKLLNIIIVTWALPFALYLICFGAPDRSYYFLSIALPLMSCVGSPVIWQWRGHLEAFGRRAALTVLVSTVALCGLEAMRYVETDLGIYKGGLDREKNSEAVASGRELDRLYLSRIPHDGSIRILRDDPVGAGSVYIPQIERFDVLQFSGLMKYEDVEKTRPKFIVLLRSSIEFYSSERFLRQYSGYPEDTLNRSFGHPFLRASYRFYRDAKENQLKAYHRVWANSYAVAFERD